MPFVFTPIIVLAVKGSNVKFNTGLGASMSAHQARFVFQPRWQTQETIPNLLTLAHLWLPTLKKPRPPQA